MYRQLYYLIIIEIISLFVKTIRVNTKDNTNKQKITLLHVLISNASMLFFSLFYFIMHGIIIYVLCSYNLDIFAWIYLGAGILVLVIRILLLLSSLFSSGTSGTSIPMQYPDMPSPQIQPTNNALNTMLSNNLGLPLASNPTKDGLNLVFNTDIHPDKKLFPTKKKIKDLYK
jgi:hypothetical protein